MFYSGDFLLLRAGQSFFLRLMTLKISVHSTIVMKDKVSQRIRALYAAKIFKHWPVFRIDIPDKLFA